MSRAFPDPFGRQVISSTRGGRMKWWAFLLAATMAVSLMSVGIARAHSYGLLRGARGRGRYLPAAEASGDGWIETSRAGIAPGPELFREGVRAVYGGPEG